MTWKVDKPFGVEVVGRGPATPALIGLGRICAQEALHDIQLMGGKGIKKHRKALDANNWVEAIVIQNGPIPYIKVKVFSQGGAEEKKLIIAIPFEVYVAGSAFRNGNTSVIGTTHVYVAEFTDSGQFVRQVDLGELTGVLPAYTDKYDVCGPYIVAGSDPKNPITAGLFSFGGYSSARLYGIKNRYSGEFSGNLYQGGLPLETLPGSTSGIVQVPGGMVLILGIAGGTLTWAKKVDGEWATFTISHDLDAVYWTQAVQFVIDEEGYATGIGYTGNDLNKLKATGEIVLRVSPEAEVSLLSAVSFAVIAGDPSNPATENYWHVTVIPGETTGGFEQTYSFSNPGTGAGFDSAQGRVGVKVNYGSCSNIFSYAVFAKTTYVETDFTNFQQTKLEDRGLLAYYTATVADSRGFYTGDTVQINESYSCFGVDYPVSFEITFSDWQSVNGVITDPSVSVDGAEYRYSNWGSVTPLHNLIGGGYFTRTGALTDISGSAGYVLTKGTPYKAAFGKDGTVCKASTIEVQNPRSQASETITDNSTATAVTNGISEIAVYVDKIKTYHYSGWLYFEDVVMSWGTGSRLTCSYKMEQRSGQYYSYNYGYIGDAVVGIADGFSGENTLTTGEYDGPASSLTTTGLETRRQDDKTWKTFFLFESDPEYSVGTVYQYEHTSDENGNPITVGQVNLLGIENITLGSKSYQGDELERINGDNGYMALYSRYNMPFNETKSGSSFILQNFSLDYYSLYGFADGRIYSLPESVLNVALVSGGWWMGDAGGQSPAGFTSKVLFKSSDDDEQNTINQTRADSIQSYFDTNFAGKDLRFLGLSVFQQTFEVN